MLRSQEVGQQKSGVMTEATAKALEAMCDLVKDRSVKEWAWQAAVAGLTHFKNVALAMAVGQAGQLGLALGAAATSEALTQAGGYLWISYRDQTDTARYHIGQATREFIEHAQRLLESGQVSDAEEMQLQLTYHCGNRNWLPGVSKAMRRQVICRRRCSGEPGRWVSILTPEPHSSKSCRPTGPWAARY